jgi:hypothetical protein
MQFTFGRLEIDLMWSLSRWSGKDLHSFVIKYLLYSWPIVLDILRVILPWKMDFERL